MDTVNLFDTIKRLFANARFVRGVNRAMLPIVVTTSSRLYKVTFLDSKSLSAATRQTLAAHSKIIHDAAKFCASLSAQVEVTPTRLARRSMKALNETALLIYSKYVDHDHTDPAWEGAYRSYEAAEIELLQVLMLLAALSSLWALFKPGASKEIEEENKLSKRLSFLATVFVDRDQFLLARSRITSHLDRIGDGSFKSLDLHTRAACVRALSRAARMRGETEGESLQALQTHCDSLRTAAGHLSHQRSPYYWLLGSGRDLWLPQANRRGTCNAIAPLSARSYSIFNICGSLSALAVCGASLTLMSVGPLRTIVALIALTPALSDLSNRLLDIALFFKNPERRLPRIEFSGRLPNTAATVIAVPTVLTSRARIEDVFRICESNLLSACDSNVYLALLTDWPDKQDCSISASELDTLRHMEALVQTFNYTFWSVTCPRMFVLHRHRQYCPSQNLWMGLERKRGKLELLNRIILGKEHQEICITTEAFSSAMKRVNFVFVIDDNTHLPRNSVHKTLGAIQHPENFRPSDQGKTQLRYGILQPFPCVTQESARRLGIFESLLEAQFDETSPPEFVRSVQFDAMAQSSFYGKGLYHVKTFDAMLGRKVPRDTIISHDIIEGAIVPTAYIGDVVLPEIAPSSLRDYFCRLHRWNRGDCQNLWLAFTKLSGAGLSILGIYTIFHFVRRSLAPLGLIISFAAITTMAGMLITLAAFLSYIVLPDLLFVSTAISVALWRGNFLLRLPHFVSQLKQTCRRSTCTLMLLPCMAGISLDAVIRSTIRLFTGKMLLEWRVSDFSASRRSDYTAVDYSAFGGVITALCIVLMILRSAPRHQGIGFKLAYLVLGMIWICGGILYIRSGRGAAPRKE